ncbi:39S ribosomal protein L18, mitochondrial [Trichoplax sp. H2]|nr:39S ribosomal protein L18, mitochondrial [Trichoplax sp. H2]|eukprot:RDD41133.1 39S ribosomal protein L18, mitochondrial [Trichoplax sp. H2]
MSSLPTCIGHRLLMNISNTMFFGYRALSTSTIANTLKPAAKYSSSDDMMDKEDGTKQLKYATVFNNRNPRNLELMALAPKARGYGTNPIRQDYYHKAYLEISNWHISAYVCHRDGHRVASASTKEFPIARHLYKTSDVAAAENIGRVLAQRCHAAGIERLIVDRILTKQRSKKTVAFIRAFRRNGILLNEPRQNYKIIQ